MLDEYDFSKGVRGKYASRYAQSVMSQDEIEQQLAHYEQVFGMSSEEFLKRKRDGTVPDIFETMDWMILLRYR